MQRVHDPIRLIVLLRFLRMQLGNVLPIQLSPAHRAAQVLYTPFVQTNRVEDVLAYCLTDSGVEIEFLQTDRTSLHIFLVLNANKLGWHELLEMRNIEDYGLSLPLPLPRVTMPFLAVDQYYQDHGDKDEQSSSHIAQNEKDRRAWCLSTETITEGKIWTDWARHVDK